MKTSLNVVRISLRLISMSLLMLFLVVTYFPQSSEKFADAMHNGAHIERVQDEQDWLDWLNSEDREPEFNVPDDGSRISPQEQLEQRTRKFAEEMDNANIKHQQTTAAIGKQYGGYLENLNLSPEHPNFGKILLCVDNFYRQDISQKNSSYQNNLQTTIDSFINDSWHIMQENKKLNTHCDNDNDSSSTQEESHVEPTKNNDKLTAENDNDTDSSFAQKERYAEPIPNNYNNANETNTGQNGNELTEEEEEDMESNVNCNLS